MAAALNPENTPVIVGIGEITDRPEDPARGLEPLVLMEQALYRAEQDAGATLLNRIDSIDIVNQVTWPYENMPAQLAARIGATPARGVYGPVGGESPVRFLHEAAARIARGESEIAVVCGAEAQSTLDKSRKAGIKLPWTPKPEKFDPPLRGADFVHAAALNLGAFMPVTIYPFYENATAAYWGQTPAQAQAESGALWSAFSRVAAENPSAWLPRFHTPAEITTPSPANRLIAWPYTKLMVANPSVNQGGAVILTSLALARATGIPESKCIFVHGGAAAAEPRDYLQRDTYHASTAQDAVLHRVQSIAGTGGFAAVELYSCFPCVPKMAGRTLGLPSGVVPTVAGGLTFFGAPLNTYMTHAACAMTRRLRAGGGIGLLYGQGEFVTKHHGLVVSAEPAAHSRILDAPSVQEEADRQRGPVSAFSTSATGAASLESFTVIYDREGAPSHGVVIARVGGAQRVLARVPGAAADAIARLTDLAASPIGAAGDIAAAPDELVWSFS
jgi:acetyl-CoA C-acetyltransferase